MIPAHIARPNFAGPLLWPRLWWTTFYLAHFSTLWRSTHEIPPLCPTAARDATFTPWPWLPPGVKVFKHVIQGEILLSSLFSTTLVMFYANHTCIYTFYNLILTSTRIYWIHVTLIKQFVKDIYQKQLILSPSKCSILKCWSTLLLTRFTKLQFWPKTSQVRTLLVSNDIKKNSCHCYRYSYSTPDRRQS